MGVPFRQQAAIAAMNLDSLVRELNLKSKSVSPALRFQVDVSSGSSVIQVFDRSSGELIRQIPPEKASALARNPVAIDLERIEQAERDDPDGGVCVGRPVEGAEVRIVPLGFDAVREILHHRLGYDHLELERQAFDVDLKYDDGLSILRRLRQLRHVLFHVVQVVACAPHHGQ